MAKPHAPEISRGDRGFALLIVLWWTVLLALLGAQLASASRLEARRASNVRGAAMAQAAAEGAVQEAIFHLVDSSAGRWQADGALHVLPMPGGLAQVTIQSEAAKIGLNVASSSLLAALLSRLGVAPLDAAAMADAVLDWRTQTQVRRPLGAKAADYIAAALPYAPPGENFETLDELAMVRGMTPALVARLAPYVSVYQTSDPDPVLASPPVQLALLDAHETPAASDQAMAVPVMDITVAVELSAGTRKARHCVVRLAAGTGREPFQILDDY